MEENDVLFERQQSTDKLISCIENLYNMPDKPYDITRINIFEARERIRKVIEENGMSVEMIQEIIQKIDDRKAGENKEQIALVKKLLKKYVDDKNPDLDER